MMHYHHPIYRDNPFLEEEGGLSGGMVVAMSFMYDHFLENEFTSILEKASLTDEIGYKHDSRHTIKYTSDLITSETSKWIYGMFREKTCWTRKEEKTLFAMICYYPYMQHELRKGIVYSETLYNYTDFLLEFALSFPSHFLNLFTSSYHENKSLCQQDTVEGHVMCDMFMTYNGDYEEYIVPSMLLVMTQVWSLNTKGMEAVKSTVQNLTTDFIPGIKKYLESSREDCDDTPDGFYILIETSIANLVHDLVVAKLVGLSLTYKKIYCEFLDSYCDLLKSYEDRSYKDLNDWSIVRCSSEFIEEVSLFKKRINYQEETATETP